MQTIFLLNTVSLSNIQISFEVHKPKWNKDSFFVFRVQVIQTPIKDFLGDLRWNALQQLLTAFRQSPSS